MTLFSLAACGSRSWSRPEALWDDPAGWAHGAVLAEDSTRAVVAAWRVTRDDDPSGPEPAIWSARRTRGGWDGPVRVDVDESGPLGTDGDGPAHLAVIGDEALVVFVSARGGPRQLWSARRRGAAAWTPARPVPGTAGAGPFATAFRAGRMVAVWSTGTDVFLVRYAQAAGWTAPQRLPAPATSLPLAGLGVALADDGTAAVTSAHSNAGTVRIPAVELFGLTVTPDGAGPQSRLTATFGAGFRHDLAGSGGGTFVAAWTPEGVSSAMARGGAPWTPLPPAEPGASVIDGSVGRLAASESAILIAYTGAAADTVLVRRLGAEEWGTPETVRGSGLAHVRDAVPAAGVDGSAFVLWGEAPDPYRGRQDLWASPSWPRGGWSSPEPLRAEPDCGPRPRDDLDSRAVPGALLATSLGDVVAVWTDTTCGTAALWASALTR